MLRKLKQFFCVHYPNWVYSRIVYDSNPPSSERICENCGTLERIAASDVELEKRDGKKFRRLVREYGA